MGKHPLLTESGDHLLLGNEAIVRGALEAGVAMVTCYPGTPSSEVVDTFRRIGARDRYTMEYSINEKVAMEVACGAALSGALSLVCMKHVGLNVAADPLFTTAYTGLPGGLVVLSADDPGCHSSQNEQDNRGYARLAHLPCFEPCSPAEAKEMTREAFRIARTLEQPVLLRTTTRVNHMRGCVSFDSLPDGPSRKEFTKNPRRFVPLPAVARVRHKELIGILEQARELSEKSPFTKSVCHDGVQYGIITSGVARNYVADALIDLDLQEKVNVLEIGMTWPLPVEQITSFLKKCSTVLVVEEGEAFLEHDIRAIASRQGLATVIEGKNKTLTPLGEYSKPLVAQRLNEWLKLNITFPALRPIVPDLPVRPPNLCPGCSHRAVYYAARHVFGDDVVYASDIGCYTLGFVPPLRCADFLFCMGSSVSGGSGFSKGSGLSVVSFIGDSTFFHSGMTGLANAVFNKHELILIILDNGTTAMTGHQPNPGMVQEALGDACCHLDIEQIVKALGVTQTTTVSAYNLKAVTEAMETFKTMHGVRVLIAKEPCVLYARRTLGKKKPMVATVVAQNADTERCLKELACPAFYKKGSDVAVDENLCSGCMVCLQVAPGSFKAVKRGGLA